MKCISLWQPWASLWLTGAKVFETRSWYTAHRGPLLVHAAATKQVRGEHLTRAFECIVLAECGARWETDLPYGQIIGRITLVNCVRTEDLRSGRVPVFSMEDECGDFSPGRYGWERAQELHRFKEPVPYRGRQRIFDVPDDLIHGKVLEVVHV